MELAGRTVAIVGLGRSGLAAGRLARSLGARVVGNDVRDLAALAGTADEARALGLELRVGGHDDAVFADVDLIILSPGVPAIPAVERAEARGVPVVGEAEFALSRCTGRVVGITGTNGKSTVTTLVGEMVARAGIPTFVGGNLGTPLADAVGTDAGTHGVLVVELSSFQLERAVSLRCHVAVLLNITDDHLDRYDGFAGYAAAKGRIFAAQRPEDVAIVPDGDALCLSLARAGRARIRTYGGELGVVRREGDALVDSAGHAGLTLAELGIKGLHNADNAAAAVLAARAVGVDDAVLREVLTTFRGLPHRMVLVRTLDGVEYYDDSKATNVGAAVAALDGLRGRAGKVVMILGGVDKGGSYEPLRARLEQTGRAVVCLGAARPLLAAAFDGASVPRVEVESMEDAVVTARGLARPGDVVLLAPACASFDMFTGYAHRGRVFQAAVNALSEAS